MPAHEIQVGAGDYLSLKPNQARAVASGTILRESTVSVLDGYLALQITMRERTERHTTIAARRSPVRVWDTA